jgi:hypothetical protein
MILMVKHTRVSLEAGKTWVFAIALDWPGWCRRGKGEEGALEVLREYEDRYRALVGPTFKPGELEVIGRIESGMYADFGVPEAQGPWDAEALTAKEADRMTGLLEKCWQGFDAAVAKAPTALAKGPRGGGRDRDAIVEHVQRAERSYARKLGVRLPSGTPLPEHRAALAAALRAVPTDEKWPVRYGLTRVAWHVTDHLWEIQDKG